MNWYKRDLSICADFTVKMDVEKNMAHFFEKMVLILLPNGRSLYLNIYDVDHSYDYL